METEDMMKDFYDRTVKAMQDNIRELVALSHLCIRELTASMESLRRSEDRFEDAESMERSRALADAVQSACSDMKRDAEVLESFLDQDDRISPIDVGSVCEDMLWHDEDLLYRWKTYRDFADAQRDPEQENAYSRAYEILVAHRETAARIHMRLISLKPPATMGIYTM